MKQNKNNGDSFKLAIISDDKDQATALSPQTPKGPQKETGSLLYIWFW